MEFDPKIRLSLLLKLSATAFDRCLTRTTNDIELTSSQCQVLGFIHARTNQGEVNPIDIERHYHLKRPTVSGILQRLEKKDFITFVPSSKDHRYKQIVLTRKAMDHHERMEEAILATEKKMFRNVSDEEQQYMCGLLKRMICNLADDVCEQDMPLQKMQ